MPMTKVDNEHEQLILMLNQLTDEREILFRENEYLKAKLNESVLMETINEMRKERDLLFRLLSNLTMNKNKDYLKHNIKENNSYILPPPAYRTLNGTSYPPTKKGSTLPCHNPSATTNYDRSHRFKANIEQPKPTSIHRVEGKKESSLNNSDELSSLSSHVKQSQSNKKIFVYKTSSMPQAQEFPKLPRKHDVQLKHSQNSPFQHYRSQSLQDLT